MTETRTGGVEPGTEAGRVLMEFLAAIKPFLEDAPVLSDGSLERIRPLVTAIEQEARRLALAEAADELAANPEVLVSRDGIVANLRARLSEEARKP